MLKHSSPKKSVSLFHESLDCPQNVGITRRSAKKPLRDYQISHFPNRGAIS